MNTSRSEAAEQVVSTHTLSKFFISKEKIPDEHKWRGTLLG
jgi:hypothetical protein